MINGKVGDFSPVGRYNGKVLIDSDIGREMALDLVALRLRGCYEDVKEFLNNGNGEHDATDKKLYFCARGIDTLLQYLSESDEAAT